VPRKHPTHSFSTVTPRIAVTAGEPAGIGPELCLALARTRLASRVVIVADRDLLRSRAKKLRMAVDIRDFDARSELPVSRAPASALLVRHVALAAPVAAGKLDPANSAYVLRSLEIAADGCRDGVFAAMATAPVHKGVINDAGIAFTGHTEYLAAHTGARHVVMMLVGGGMRVALATTHLPLAQVPGALTKEGLCRTLAVIDADLRRRFRVARPRIIVAGLNPHSGEAGHLGREDLDVIVPAIAAAKAAGIDARGPIPADTLFVPDRLKGADCVLAMYHDQGLPVLKYASFGRGVNVTLGLPFVRTSVDHGTALDIAGSGKADPGSLIEALKLAIELASSS
jgi:4-hydroxythreonine-4-phosphate dehydrogenase